MREPTALKGKVVCAALVISAAIMNSSSGNGATKNVQRSFTVVDDIAVAQFGDPNTALTAPITASPDNSSYVIYSERGRLDLNRPEGTLVWYSDQELRSYIRHGDRAAEVTPLWRLSRSAWRDGPVVTNIRWLQDSSGVAFLQKNEEGVTVLYLADLKTKTVRSLTPDRQEVLGFAMRDRDNFAYVIASPTIVENAAKESRLPAIVGTGRSLTDLLFPPDRYVGASSPDLGEMWVVHDGRRFKILDPKSHEPLPIHQAGEEAISMSPDGRLVVTALALESVPPEWTGAFPPPLAGSTWRVQAGRQNVHAPNTVWFVSEYVLIDLASGEVHSIVHAPIGDTAGWWWAKIGSSWSPDGSSILLSNTFIPDHRPADARSARRPCIAVIRVKSGNASCVEEVRSETETGFEPGFVVIDDAHFVDATGQQVRVEHLLAPSGQQFVKFRWSNDQGWRAEADDTPSHDITLAVNEDLNTPPMLLAVDHASGKRRIIFDPNAQLRTIGLEQASVFKWLDKTGRSWVGGLYLPPHHEGRRYPLVIQPHGFSPELFRPSGLFPTAMAARELASVGIAVLQVNDCPASGTPDEAQCQLDGYESAIHTLETAGIADTSRVGIIGFSRTCYYVMAAMTSKAVPIAAASITDGVNYGYLQYLESVDSFGGYFARDADKINGARPFGDGLLRWFKTSPMFNLARVHAPLQVVARGRAALVDMWEPYAALRRMNKPVDLIVLADDATHVLTNPAERMVSQGGTVDWFRFWLQGYEDPSEAKVDQYHRWENLCDMQVAANPGQPTFCVPTKAD
jgi:dipeptidyl aminopeptidase/acylaminoacyl peptidase